MSKGLVWVRQKLVDHKIERNPATEGGKGAPIYHKTRKKTQFSKTPLNTETENPHLPQFVARGGWALAAPLTVLCNVTTKQSKIVHPPGRMCFKSCDAGGGSSPPPVDPTYRNRGRFGREHTQAAQLPQQAPGVGRFESPADGHVCHPWRALRGRIAAWCCFIWKGWAERK